MTGFSHRRTGAILAVLFSIAVTCAPQVSYAQQIAPTPEMTKNVMNLTKKTWVQFRNYDGKQLLYFTHFFAWKCAIKEVHYSINSKELSETLTLPECNPDAPFDVDPIKHTVYKTYPLGHANQVTVQIIYSDDTKSETLSFAPCNVERDQSCAKLVE